MVLFMHVTNKKAVAVACSRALGFQIAVSSGDCQFRAGASIDRRTVHRYKCPYIAAGMKPARRRAEAIAGMEVMP